MNNGLLSEIGRRGSPSAFALVLSASLPNGELGALVESVSPEKAAAAAGIQVGDVIVSVNDTPVKNAGDASRAVAQANKAGRKSVLLLIERGDAQTFIAVPFDRA